MFCGHPSGSWRAFEGSLHITAVKLRMESNFLRASSQRTISIDVLDTFWTQPFQRDP